MKSLITSILLVFISSFCFSQNVELDYDKIIEKGDAEIIFPIEITITGAEKRTSVKWDVTLDRSSSQLDVDQLREITVSTEDDSIRFDKGKGSRTIYITLKKGLTILTPNGQQLSIKVATELPTNDLVTINLVPANNYTYSLRDYLERESLKLDYVTRVESADNVLTVVGYMKDRDLIVRRKLFLKRGDVYSIGEITPYKPQVSLITVPFKLRPKSDGFRSFATSGVSNIGLNVDFFGYKEDKYFSNGKKASRRIGFGFWAAPSVEELDSVYTKGYLKKDVKSKQLFISAGLSLSYAYNNITFVLVPAGLDIPTSNTGKEWVYKNKRWWGFGIGVDPKFLTSIFNK